MLCTKQSEIASTGSHIHNSVLATLQKEGQVFHDFESNLHIYASGESDTLNKCPRVLSGAVLRCGLFDALYDGGEWSCICPETGDWGCIYPETVVDARARNVSLVGDIGVCMVSFVRVVTRVDREVLNSAGEWVSSYLNE